MNPLNKFIFCTGVILCFAAVICAIFGIIYMANLQEYRTDLPCYDRAGNKINGMACSGVQTTSAGLNFFVAFVSSTFIGLLLIMCAVRRDSDEYIEDLKKKHNNYIQQRLKDINERNERRQKERKQ